MSSGNEDKGNESPFTYLRDPLFDPHTCTFNRPLEMADLGEFAPDNSPDLYNQVPQSDLSVDEMKAQLRMLKLDGDGDFCNRYVLVKAPPSGKSDEKPNELELVVTKQETTNTTKCLNLDFVYGTMKMQDRAKLIINFHQDLSYHSKIERANDGAKGYYPIHLKFDFTEECIDHAHIYCLAPGSYNSPLKLKAWLTHSSCNQDHAVIRTDHIPRSARIALRTAKPGSDHASLVLLNGYSRMLAPKFSDRDNDDYAGEDDDSEDGASEERTGLVAGMNTFDFQKAVSDEIDGMLGIPPTDEMNELDDMTIQAAIEASLRDQMGKQE